MLQREAVLLQYTVVFVVFTAIYHIIGMYDKSAFNREMDMVDAFYFAVVTQSTVGYGDLHPKKLYAKLIVVFHILISFLLILVPLSSKLKASAAPSVPPARP